MCSRDDILVRSIYVGFLGVILTIAFTAGNVFSLNWTLVLWQILCPLVCGGTILLLDRVSKQTRGLPNVVVCFAIVAGVLGINLTLGRPAYDVAFYAALGFGIGALTGAMAGRSRFSTLFIPFVALSSTGILGWQAWQAGRFTADAMWQMVSVVASLSLILGVLAPTRTKATASITFVFALLFAATWLWPILILSHSANNWHISLWIWVFEIAAAFVWFGLARLSLRRFWSVPALTRHFFARKLKCLLDHISSDHILAFQKTYAQTEKSWRSAMIRQAVSVETLAAWEDIIGYQQIAFGQDTLDILAEVAQTAQTELRSGLLHLFYNGVQREPDIVWQPCLDKLVKLDQATALKAGQQRLTAMGDPSPMCLLLTKVDLPQYETGMLALVKAAPTLALPARGALVSFINHEAQNQTPSPSVYEELVEFVVTEARRRPPECAAVALALLSSLRSEAVLPLYHARRENRITTCLLESAERDAQLRPYVIETFRIVLQIDTPADVTNLQDWLYPFNMRPVEDEETPPHLEELVNEPRDRVTAAHVTTWIYREDGKISHLLLAGHANPPICRKISAKLFSTFLEYDGSGVEEPLTVPGAFFMAAPQKVLPGKGNLPPLDDLLQQLQMLQEPTGALQLQEVRQVSYTEVRDGLRSEMEKALKSDRPVWLYRSRPELPSHAVALPFYVIEAQKLSPLSFELDAKLFQDSQFTGLLEAQRLELRHEMIADARRRKRIYEEWHVLDTNTIRQLAHKLFERVLPGASYHEQDKLSETYVQNVLKLPSTDLLPFFFDLPPQVRSWLLLKQSQQLRQFLERQKPGFIQSDKQWDDLLKLVQDGEYPVHGLRNYDEATIVGSGNISGYASLQELVELNLPNLIHSDNECIEKMDELLRKYDDPQREARIEAINFGTFLDAFLRGWPSVFLPDKEAQERYKALCAEQRKVVWEVIHNLLIDRGIRMDPLQMDNVVFAVRQLDKLRIQVVPYYLTSDNAFMVLLAPHFGITYYVNAWQQRSLVMSANKGKKNNGASCELSCTAAEQALAAQDTEAALAHFKQSLRIHPSVAAHHLFTRFWSVASQNTSSQLENRLSLVESRHDFDQNRPQDIQKLGRFLEHYPNFLPDPYLLLGFDAHEPLTDVPRCRQELDVLRSEHEQLVAVRKKLKEEYNNRAARYVNAQNVHSQLLRELVDDQVLIPEFSFLFDLNESMPRFSAEQATRYLVEQWMSIRGLQRRESLQKTVEEGPAALRHLREQIEAKTADLNSIDEKIVWAEEALHEASQKAWQSLQSVPNDFVKHAMRLNASHVSRILREGMFFPSPGYVKHIAPLNGLLQGNDYLHIVQRLREGIHTKEGNLIDQLRDSTPHAQQTVLKKLRSVIDACLVTQHLEDSNTSALRDLRDLLERFDQQVDSIARELMIRHRINDITSDYIGRAYQFYNEAASSMPEITEVRRKLSNCQYLVDDYRHALHTLIGAPNIPILNGFANAQFHILISDPLKVDTIIVDAGSKTIQVIDPSGQSYSVLGFEGLSEVECRHLAAEFVKPDYLTRLKASELPPAYAILLIPIAVPPQTKLWQDVLLALEPWLIKVLAYMGIAPVDTDGNQLKQALAYFDHTPIVERVVVDPIDIRHRFLDSIGIYEVNIIEV